MTLLAACSPGSADDPAAGSDPAASYQMVPPEGSALVAPPERQVRTAAVGSCAGLGTAGWEVRCGVWTSRDADLAWVVERSPAGAVRTLFMRGVGGADYEVVLVDDAPPGTYRSVNVVLADLDGDGGAEAVVGARSAGTGGALAVDVVGRPGVVLAHVELDAGVVEIDGSDLLTFSAGYAPDDPTCCPSTFIRARIRLRDGQLQVVDASGVDPAEVPVSVV